MTKKRLLEDCLNNTTRSFFSHHPESDQDRGDKRDRDADCKIVISLWCEMIQYIVTKAGSERKQAESVAMAMCGRPGEVTVPVGHNAVHLFSRELGPTNPAC